MSERLDLRVPPGAAGQRLDRWLGSDPRIGSRSAAQQLLAGGLVLVDGLMRKASHVLSGGERLTVELPERAPAALADAPGVPIVYRDEDLLVVDKPAGLVVHPAPGLKDPTLAELLAPLAGGGRDPARLGIVHRLDRDTSGLLVIARDEQAHRHLSEQIRAREVRREYLALISARIEARTGTIDAPLGRDRAAGGRMAVGGRAARSARTHFETIELLPAHSLLRVRLETGRTHQIRAHLASIDHPVAGDPLYGNEGELGLTRQFLHATRLRFSHPRSGEELDLRSTLPEDLELALQRARL